MKNKVNNNWPQVMIHLTRHTQKNPRYNWAGDFTNVPKLIGNDLFVPFNGRIFAGHIDLETEEIFPEKGFNEEMDKAFKKRLDDTLEWIKSL